MSTHDSATDAPRHPTSVAPGEAAGDGLDEPLGEWLGERLEWIVDIHANRIAGRADVGRWWDGMSDYARRKHLGCAVRELDGQRHALLEERKALLSSWWRAMEAAGIEVHESLPDAVRGMRDERDAAIERAERAEADRDATAQRAGAAEFTRGEWRRRAEDAEARVRELESDAELAVAIHRATLRSEMCGLVDGAHVVWQHVQSLRTQLEGERSRVRELEAMVYAPIPPCSPDADPTPEPFDAWHARECPWVVKLYPKEARRGWRGSPCPGEMVFSMGQKSVAPERFKGRTCRAVYAAEVLGRGGEEGAGE